MNKTSTNSFLFGKRSSFYTLLGQKKAYSVGFTWIYGLISLFAIGLIFIIFDQVFVGNIVPVIKNQVNSSVSNIPQTDVIDIFGNIDKYMTFWHALPFILFILVIIYMLIAAVRREGDEGQLGGGM
jgi:hypothetical protein